ncbi:molybdopterin synthase catalytic subunit [Ancylobacter sp. 3268]|uniref:molybdenum cofactor biosynthesis protein MoaE n=1 Tax=Ancylobacter sp. 3268 TaxID=2817752 RepID=UPI0028657F11|nr:molybdenum cofactor biosynthesis protein MoaE [Ancylobacter sp. 3268]MDR6951748.1 molybdopterin synthase catalytic subunit [Ancylobacter sp. 3268]
MPAAAPPDDRFTVRIQAEDFDTAAEVAALSAGRVDIGAVVTFSGLCRADDAGDSAPNGSRLVALTLEHYPGMAEEEIRRLVDEARARWPLLGATVIHRHGRIVPGENIVLVVTASPHRGAAFDAAAFLMDWLKTRAPFWKLEERAEARSWVAAKEADDAAAERWTAGTP